MRRSRNFRQGGGGPGQSDKKSSDNLMLFFFLFFFLSLFYLSQMVNFKEIYRPRGGPTFSRGVPTFSRGGSNCFFSIETHITCHFPVGSGPPVPPSGSALAVLYPVSSVGGAVFLRIRVLYQTRDSSFCILLWLQAAFDNILIHCGTITTVGPLLF